MIILFVVISLRTPPTPWGDVSQALIYHQVSNCVHSVVENWGEKVKKFVENISLCVCVCALIDNELLHNIVKVAVVQFVFG